jgi:prepilin-type processing-associated H-X9-DG protein
MLLRRWFWVCGCIAAVVAVAGCGGDGGGGGGGQAAERDLHKLGLLYHSALMTNRNGPANAEELAAVAEDKEGQQAIRGLKEGRYVFLWNVKLLGHPQGTDQLVLAYEKDAPTKGGYVLFLDGHVARKSAQEFNELPKPKSR